MKFRREQDGAEIELSGTWAAVAEEPIAQWRDVTASCEDGVALWDALYESLYASAPRHRVRKVEVNVIGPGVPHGCQKQWAFIVEKRG